MDKLASSTMVGLSHHIVMGVVSEPQLIGISSSNKHLQLKKLPSPTKPFHFFHGGAWWVPPINCKCFLTPPKPPTWLPIFKIFRIFSYNIKCQMEFHNL